MWLLFIAAIAISMLFRLPEQVQRFRAKREIARLKAEAAAEVGQPQSPTEALLWFQRNGYIARGPGPYTGSINGAPSRGIEVMAERQLWFGNLFWRPQSVKVSYYFDNTGRYWRDVWYAWPLDLTGTRVSPSYSGDAAYAGFLPAVALIVILILNVRREARSANGQCVECAYNLTKSNSEVCPECGATLNQKAETQKAEMR
jgi:hypothetical protein